MSKHFGKLFSHRLGVPCEVVFHDDGLELAKSFEKKGISLGFIYGYELAWIRDQYPKLTPLAVTVPYCEHYQACIVVRKDSDYQGCDDLTGKRIALPTVSRGHCVLFLERQGPNHKTLSRPDSVEDALDDVVDGLADAAVVESGILTTFARQKPGRSDQLAVLSQSEVFPLAVAVYREGDLPNEKVDTIRNLMLTAGKVPLERRIMSLFRLARFAPVPEDYEDQLRKIRKAYPPPGE